MSISTIPLAQGDKAKWRKDKAGFLSVKLDGVPQRTDVVIKGGRVHSYAARTRQGEPVLSTQRQTEEFLEAFAATGIIGQGAISFVSEVTDVELVHFKDVSGKVRRQSQQDGLIHNFFDFTAHTTTGITAGFGTRHEMLTMLMQHIQLPHSKRCFQYRVITPDEFRRVKERLLQMHPNCEGLVWRSADAVWAPNTRRPDYQKIVNDPVHDLRVIGYAEAVSVSGAKKGMVGALTVEYKGGTATVGAGKMGHAERKQLWIEWVAAGKPLLNRIATVKCKRDPSYKLMRQPTFQHWRPEKKEPSYG